MAETSEHRLTRIEVRLEAHEEQCVKLFEAQERSNERMLTLIGEGRDTVREIYKTIAEHRAEGAAQHALETASTEKKIGVVSNDVHNRIDGIEADRLTRERSSFETKLSAKEKELDEYKQAAAARFRNMISIAGILLSLAVTLGVIGTIR